MRELWKLRKYIWRYKWMYLTGLLMLTGVDYIQLLVPKIISRAITGLEAKSLDSAALLELALTVIAIWVGVGGFRFGWRYCVFGSAMKVERDLRRDFYGKVIRLPVEFFTRNRTGDLLALSSNDMLAVRRATGDGLIILGDVFILTGLTLMMMGNIDLKLTLFVFIPLPLISLMFLFFGPIIHRLFLRVQDSFGALTTRTEENITGVRVVRSYVQEEWEKKKFEKFNVDYRDKNLKMVVVDGLFHSLMFLLPSVSFALLLIFGGPMVVKGTLSLGDFVAMNLYVGILVWPMIAIGWVFNLFQRGGASIKRIWKVMEENIEFKCVEKEPDGDIDAPIEFRDVRFAYPNSDAHALRGLTLSINKGDTVAIMGKTGSGKSTLINLLTRMFDPPRGTVKVGGSDILDLPKDKLRALFSVAPQESFLFTDSIWRNIAFANAQSEKKEIARVARSAHIYDDIMTLPYNFETIVGERGVNLSGGQRQRTSIARAFMASRKVIVLDDSLSAVDTVTEAAILESLRKEKEGRTLIVITHRVNAARLADKIYMLEGGKVLEEGTFDELLKKDGLFKDIHDRQQLETDE